MRQFKYFLQTKKVRRNEVNLSEYSSVISSAKHRFDVFSKINMDTDNYLFIFENLYEAIRGLIDSQLLKAGYKSYSHEAIISFAYEKGLLNEDESLVLDEIRKKRNLIRYYGNTYEYSLISKKIDECKKIYSRLITILA